MWVSGERHAPTALQLRNTAGSHCTGGWAYTRAGLNKNIQSRVPLELHL